MLIHYMSVHMFMLLSKQKPVGQNLNPDPVIYKAVSPYKYIRNYMLYI